MNHDEYKFERSEDGHAWEAEDARRAVRVIQDNFACPVADLKPQLSTSDGVFCGAAFYRLADQQ